MYESINDIKKKINEHEIIPNGYEEYRYNYSLNKNEKKIIEEDKNISRPFILRLRSKEYGNHLERSGLYIKFYINILNDKTFPVEMDLSSTIEELRVKIKEMENIPINKYNLFYSGFVLNNGHVLLDYNICNRSIVHLVFISNVIKIYIKILAGKTIILNYIDPNGIIEDIKDIINKKENIPKDKQILTFNDKDLENDKRISELGINNDSILCLKIIFDIQQKLINVIFISKDENICYPFLCYNNDKFSKLEHLFLNKFPDYNKLDISFSVKGKKIDRNKTLDENNIVYGDIINIS